jgi:methyl-accepting chemotaxis protein
MTLAEFLLSGTKPASLAGFVLILAVLLVVLIERKLNWPAVFVAVLGAALCAINFIQIIRLGKDGLEISTQSAQVVIALAEDVRKNKTEASEAINNINSQIAKLSDINKALVDQISKIPNGVNSTESQNSIRDLKNKTDSQSNSIIDLLNKNQQLSTSIKKQDQELVGKIQSLQLKLNLPNFNPT